MNTIIFKWNPSSSAYSMLNYLYDVTVLNQGHSVRNSWPVRNYDKIQRGDRFYWLKQGLGQIGIAACGIVASDPYEDLDWQGHGEPIFFVDLKPEVILCPEVVNLLPLDKLEKEIPDFDWRSDLSGIILTRQQNKKLESLWNEFYNSNLDYWKEVRGKHRFPDNVYLAPKKPGAKARKEENNSSKETAEK